MAVIANAKADDQANQKQGVAVTWGTMVAATDTGAPAFIGDLTEIVVQVTSPGAGTAQIEVSNDNVTYFGLSATLTGAAAAPMVVGLQRLDVPARFLRIGAIATANVAVILYGRKRGS